MKKILLFGMFLGVLFFVSALPASAWQGRMAGMGDPYGLIGDESDFLIHPHKITAGQGVRFYGNYRFNYTEVNDWDSDLDLLDLGGALVGYFHFDESSAQEYNHDSLLGAAFPLGSGRMGVFFSYNHTMGDFDGDENSSWGPYEYDMDSELEDLTLSFIYGIPINSMHIGFELGGAFRDERQEWWIPNTKNDIWPSDYEQNLHFFMNPYESDYWELFWKAGVGKKWNTTSFDWTIRGGYIISSDNEYEYSYSFGSENVDMDGDVDGFRIGSDLWFKYAVKESLTLPFILSVEYTEKDRDGDGLGVGPVDLGDRYSYENQERTFEVKAGGGVEKKVSSCGLIGAGLYYNYLQRREDLWFNNRDWPYLYDYMDFPLHKEHRLVLRIAGEQEVSSSTSLRAGLDFFYGWVTTHDFKQSARGSFTDDISLAGHDWGIAGSLGATKKFSGFTLEPFLNSGYRNLNLDGDGDLTDDSLGTTVARWDLDQDRAEWFVGGGFSILFDL